MEINTTSIKKFLGKELDFLLQDKGGPCLTITAPLEKMNPLRETNKRKVIELVEKAEVQWKRIHNRVNHSEISLIKKTKELINKIDWLRVPNGIGLYVSENNNILYPFDFPPAQKVIWSDRFMLRELIYQIQINQPFLLLSLTELKSRLYQKLDNNWEKIPDPEVNKDYPDYYLYESPSRSSSYAGQAHVKSFERDREKMESAHRLPHLNKIKAQIKKYQTASLPIVVIAKHELLHEINFANTPQEPVIEIRKDPSHFTPKELGQFAVPYVYQFTEKKIERLIGEWNELVGKGFTRNGLQASWRAAQEGNCRILLVEEDYSRSGFLIQDPTHLFLTPPTNPHTTLPDAVDDLMKTVLEKDGAVFITANGLLSNSQRISLITRY